MKKNSWAVVREGLSRKVTFKCRLGRVRKKTLQDYQGKNVPG